jgi:hypothetical protein
MDFDDLVTTLAPPPNRTGKASREQEQHLYEGAVMVAYAMHLLCTGPTDEVRIHPDGERGKQFDFSGWLRRRGFSKVSAPEKRSTAARTLIARAVLLSSIQNLAWAMSSPRSATRSCWQSAKAG